MKRLIALVLAAATLAASAQTATPPSIADPWARATGPGQRNGGAWMRIHNAGAADRLVGASSSVSQGVELHTMRMDGDVMRMRQLDAIELGAGQTVELKPGGLHLMLIGLKAPLREGETFQIELQFEKAGRLAVPVAVRPAAAGAAPHDMHKQ